MRGSDYVELQAFAAIVKHGSFVRAAAFLGVTPSALSQTIRNLEQRLGVRLLHRTTRSVAPSEAGARLLQRLLPALSELKAAEEQATQMGTLPSGTLRINTTRVAAIHYLAPLLGPFMQAYPAIRREITTDESLTDIVALGFDAGIRIGEKLEQDMIAQRLGGELCMRVVAAPAYLARHGMPEHPRDLHHHRCLSYLRPSDGSPYRWEFARADQRLEVALDSPLLVNEPEILTEVVLSGAGISYLFSHQVDAYLASGKLVALLSEWTPPFAGFYLYYPSRKNLSPVLKTFIEFVRDNQVRLLKDRGNVH